MNAAPADNREQLQGELPDDDRYTDEPIELGEVVADFLPPPEVLAKARTTVYFEIGLDLEALNWFKAEGQRLDLPFEIVMRSLLEEHVREVKAQQASGEQPTA